MRKLKRSKFIFGLAGLLYVGGLAGLLYMNEIRRKEEMKKAVPVPNSLVGNTTGKNDIQTVQEVLAGGSGLTPREKKNLQDTIAAMSPEELEAVAETIPVELCLKRIQNALDHAREFESMIKKAYEMK